LAGVEVILRVGVAISSLTIAGLAAMACVTLSGGPRLLPLAEAFDHAAENTADPVQASQLTKQALALRPVDVVAWVRLAGLQTKPMPTDLSPAALQALERSYAVGPYASQVLGSRLQLVLDHWSALGPDLQAQASSEVRAAWPVYPQKQRLLGLAGRLKNQDGALALTDLLLTLKLQDDADTAARRAAGAPALSTDREVAHVF
jgi:hypothetical protein